MSHYWFSVLSGRSLASAGLQGYGLFFFFFTCLFYSVIGSAIVQEGVLSFIGLFSELRDSGSDVGVRFLPNADHSQYTGCLSTDPRPVNPDPASGQAISVGGESGYAVVPLSGNAFSYFGADYEEMYVSQFGFITFGEPPPSIAQVGIENANNYMAIAMLWTDLEPGAESTVMYRFVGNGVEVTFVDVPVLDYYGSSQDKSCTFQAFLSFQTGEVELTWSKVYDSEQVPALIGILSGSGEAAENQFWLYEFTDCPQREPTTAPETATPAPLPGETTTLPAETETPTAVFNATPTTIPTSEATPTPTPIASASPNATTATPTAPPNSTAAPTPTPIASAAPNATEATPTAPPNSTMAPTPTPIDSAAPNATAVTPTAPPNPTAEPTPTPTRIAGGAGPNVTATPTLSPNLTTVPTSVAAPTDTPLGTVLTDSTTMPTLSPTTVPASESTSTPTPLATGTPTAVPTAEATSTPAHEASPTPTLLASAPERTPDWTQSSAATPADQPDPTANTRTETSQATTSSPELLTDLTPLGGETPTLAEGGASPSPSPDEAPSCVIDSGFTYGGSVIAGAGSTAGSSDGCCGLCSATAGCVSWTFLPGTGECTLFATPQPQRQPLAGAVSGLPLPNLAFRRPTLQSSTEPPGYSFLAVDGNKTSDREACAQTGSGAQPWWTVDLGETFQVGYVQIFRSCCEGTDQSISVMLSLEPPQAESAFPDPTATPCGFAVVPGSDPLYTMECTEGAAGRFLTIQANGGSSPLVLCEVEVFPPAAVTLEQASPPGTAFPTQTPTPTLLEPSSGTPEPTTAAVGPSTQTPTPFSTPTPTMAPVGIWQLTKTCSLLETREGVACTASFPGLPPENEYFLTVRWLKPAEAEASLSRLEAVVVNGDAVEPNCGTNAMNGVQESAWVVCLLQDVTLSAREDGRLEVSVLHTADAGIAVEIALSTAAPTPLATPPPTTVTLAPATPLAETTTGPNPTLAIATPTPDLPSPGSGGVEVAGYSRLPGQTVLGGNLGDFLADSGLEECASACDNSPGCLGFVTPSDGELPLTCSLKSSLVETAEDPGSILYARLDVEPQAPGTTTPTILPAESTPLPVPGSTDPTPLAPTTQPAPADTSAPSIGSPTTEAGTPVEPESMDAPPALPTSGSDDGSSSPTPAPSTAPVEGTVSPTQTSTPFTPTPAGSPSATPAGTPESTPSSTLPLGVSLVVPRLSAADPSTTYSDPVDTAAPVLYLHGPSSMVASAVDTFTDPGATCADEVDPQPSMTMRVWPGDGMDPVTLDATDRTWTPMGDFVVEYSCTDRSGNEAVPITRSVTPTSPCAPPERLCQGGHCSISGVCGNCSSPGCLAWPTVPLEEDVEAVVLTIPDSIRAEDAAAPVLSLAGNGALAVSETGGLLVMVHYLVVGEPWEDPGVVAMDEADGNLTDAVERSGQVDTLQPTSSGAPYVVEYLVTDHAGNKAEAQRHVHVSCPSASTMCDPSEFWPGTKAACGTNGVCGLNPALLFGGSPIPDGLEDAMLRMSMAPAPVPPEPPPTMMLLGPPVIEVSVGTPYAACTNRTPAGVLCDRGALAFSEGFGNLTELITVCSLPGGPQYLFRSGGLSPCGIDHSAPGSYTITFSATIPDSPSSHANVSRLLRVLPDCGVGEEVCPDRVSCSVDGLCEDYLSWGLGGIISADDEALQEPVLELVGPAVVEVRQGMSYDRCAAGAVHTPESPCDGGATVQQVDGPQTAAGVLALPSNLPPSICLNQSCWGLEFATKGLGGCNINTSAAEGTLFTVQFVYVDLPTRAIVSRNRTIAIIPACSDGRVLCGDGSCSPIDCALRDSLLGAGSSANPPAPELFLLGPETLELLYGERLEAGESLLPCPSMPPDGAPGCGAYASAGSGADISANIEHHLLGCGSSEPCDRACALQDIGQGPPFCLPGQYRFRYSVTDSNGFLAEATRDVLIVERGVVSFNFSLSFPGLARSDVVAVRDLLLQDGSSQAEALQQAILDAATDARGLSAGYTASSLSLLGVSVTEDLPVSLSMTVELMITTNAREIDEATDEIVARRRLHSDQPQGIESALLSASDAIRETIETAGSALSGAVLALVSSGAAAENITFFLNSSSFSSGPITPEVDEVGGEFLTVLGKLRESYGQLESSLVATARSVLAGDDGSDTLDRDENIATDYAAWSREAGASIEELYEAVNEIHEELFASAAAAAFSQAAVADSAQKLLEETRVLLDQMARRLVSSLEFLQDLSPEGSALQGCPALVANATGSYALSFAVPGDTSDQGADARSQIHTPRWVGAAPGRNRVAGGLSIRQLRKGIPSGDVCDERFPKLSSACGIVRFYERILASELSSRGRAAVEEYLAELRDPMHPYGSDPVFDGSKSLYDPWLKGREGDYYNMSEGSSEVNIRGAPQMWFPRPLGSETGARDHAFTVVIDNTIGAARAGELWASLDQGAFLDHMTEELRARMLAYNSRLDMLSFTENVFSWTPHGTITVLSPIPTTLPLSSVIGVAFVLQLVLGITYAAVAMTNQGAHWASTILAAWSRVHDAARRWWMRRGNYVQDMRSEYGFSRLNIHSEATSFATGASALEKGVSSAPASRMLSAVSHKRHTRAQGERHRCWFPGVADALDTCLSVTMLLAVGFQLASALSSKLIDLDFVYDLYESPQLSRARFFMPPKVPDGGPEAVAFSDGNAGRWNLPDNHTGFWEFNSQALAVDASVGLLMMSYGLYGLTIVLLIIRLVLVWSFQPRFTVITETIRRATPDLLVFSLVMVIVTVLLAFAAIVVFGDTLGEVSSAGGAMSYMLDFFMTGDLSAMHALAVDGSALRPAPLVAMSYVLYFATYFLVILVLLNFVLAILAFAYAFSQQEYSSLPGISQDIRLMAKRQPRPARRVMRVLRSMHAKRSGHGRGGPKWASARGVWLQGQFLTPDTLEKYLSQAAVRGLGGRPASSGRQDALREVAAQAQSAAVTEIITHRMGRRLLLDCSPDLVLRVLNRVWSSLLGRAAQSLSEVCSEAEALSRAQGEMLHELQSMLSSSAAALSSVQLLKPVRPPFRLQAEKVVPLQPADADNAMADLSGPSSPRSSDSGTDASETIPAEDCVVPVGESEPQAEPHAQVSGHGDPETGGTMSADELAGSPWASDAMSRAVVSAVLDAIVDTVSWALGQDRKAVGGTSEAPAGLPEPGSNGDPSLDATESKGVELSHRQVHRSPPASALLLPEAGGQTGLPAPRGVDLPGAPSGGKAFRPALAPGPPAVQRQSSPRAETSWRATPVAPAEPLPPEGVPARPQRGRARARRPGAPLPQPEPAAPVPQQSTWLGAPGPEAKPIGRPPAKERVLSMLSGREILASSRPERQLWGAAGAAAPEEAQRVSLQHAQKALCKVLPDRGTESTAEAEPQAAAAQGDGPRPGTAPIGREPQRGARPAGTDSGSTLAAEMVDSGEEGRYGRASPEGP